MSVLNDAVSDQSSQSPILLSTHDVSDETLVSVDEQGKWGQLFSPTNPFFGLARGSKWLPHGGVAPLISLLMMLLLVPFNLAMGLWLQPLTEAAAVSMSPLFTASVQTLQFLITYLPVFMLLALWLHRVERRPFWTVGFPTGQGIGRVMQQVGWGLLIGTLIQLVPVGIAALLGLVTLEQGPSTLQGLTALGGVLITLVGWMAQGGAEEVMTRGWLMQVIGLRHRPWIAVLVGSLFFSVLHGLNPNFNGLAAVNLTLFSLFAALTVLRAGNLWAVVGFHAAANWAQGNLLALPISGREGAGGSLLNLGLTGPQWLSGGGFGIEASLLMSLTLLSAIILVLVWPRRRM